MGVAALRDADIATLDATAALAKSHLKTLGSLMAESHASMRDNFEITVPPIDRLVALLQSVIGDEGGARMTGGGFGGACVAVLLTARVAEVTAAIKAGYRTPDGEKPLVMVERPGPGVSLL